MSVIVTEKAAKEFKRVIEEQKADLGTTALRIGIQGGGCSGFQYALGVVEVKSIDTAKDELTEQHGIQVAVDKKSALHLDGTTLDYYDGLEKRGFTFNNPLAVKTCGCGSSFST